MKRNMCHKIEIERNGMKKIPYAWTLESTMYMMLIMYKIKCILCFEHNGKYQFDLGESYWKIVKNIIKYLKRIKNMLV
jgi:hypothetical protein